MDEAKFIADFIAENSERIWRIGRKVFDNIDETLQLKLKTAYTEYLLNVERKYSKSKSFFIRNQSVDLYSYYIPISIRCNSVKIEEPSFNSCTEHSNRMVITGTGGCGKSVLMRHLFLDCIKSKKFVPILIELRDINADGLSLENIIENTFEKFGFSLSPEFIEKAKTQGHFSFFFDGYDEVDYTIRKKLISYIKLLSDKYKDCPIIISSRPDDVFNGFESFNVFDIQQLTLNQAVRLIEKLPYDNEIKTKFTLSLNEGLFEKHSSFLSNPLLLSIMLLTYGENAEIPSKLSIFYNQAYEALFQRHDANKGGYSRNRKTTLDIQDFARVFSLFSLQTYDKRTFKMSRTDCLKYIKKSRDILQKEFKPEDYLLDLLSAACLLIEDGLDVSYSHRSFQEYFVALHISSAIPEIQQKLIERYWSNIGSDSVIMLLLEINPDLIERALLIPKLEELFTLINVKNKIGITHAAKYLKLVYSSINIGENELSASWPGIDVNLSMIVHLTVKYCNTFNRMKPEEIEDYTKYLSRKYGEKEEVKSFELCNLSYKTPFLYEILSSNTWLSTKYLQSAFNAYQLLKKKHKNQTRSIEELLGI